MSILSDSSLAMALSACNDSIVSSAAHRAQTRRKKQAKLVIFMHSVIQYIQTFAPEFTAQVKCIIKQCIQRNRSGDPSFSSLPRALMVNVRNCMGAQHWAGVLSFHKCYTTEKGIQFKQRHQKLLPQSALSLSAALGIPTFPPTESFSLGNAMIEQAHSNDERIRNLAALTKFGL
jgi:hypothetical protein